MLTISRRVRPSRTPWSLAAKTSICQLGRNDAPEFSSLKQRSMNV
jgi:hypothetical protein